MRALAVVLALTGCDAADDGDDGAAEGGGKADDTDPSTFACKNVQGITLEALAQIDDPIATFLIKRGEGCPADYRAMVEKLRAVDPEGCEEGRDMTTRIVSDDARIDPNPDNFRTVTTRACGSRGNEAMFWTLLGVRAGEDIGKRTFVEMMALDRNTGLYDYWVFNGNRFTFQGNSLQAAANTISCGGCHRDGGVLMKELDEPWIHWESDGNLLPGADALFTAHGPMFGIRGDGRELEKLVRQGNDAALAARIEQQRNPKVGTVQALLRPLFCAEQINLDTAGTALESAVNEIPADALVDPRFGVARGVAIDAAEYEAAIAAAGQTVPGIAGRTDTEFKMVFPERAGFDVAYVEALVTSGIVDEDFALDVLAVDFTRPLFSDARCDLLAMAPSYGTPAPDASDAKIVAEATPTALREAFVASLTASNPAEGTAAAELLAHLSTPDDGPAHQADVDAFLEACSTRPSRELVDDVLRTTHLNRERVRTTTSLIEHREQMPSTTLQVAATAHLDPTSCELVE